MLKTHINIVFPFLSDWTYLLGNRHIKREIAIMVVSFTHLIQSQVDFKSIFHKFIFNITKSKFSITADMNHEITKNKIKY